MFEKIKICIVKIKTVICVLINCLIMPVGHLKTGENCPDKAWPPPSNHL